VNVLSSLNKMSVAQRRLLKQRASHQKRGYKTVLAKQRTHRH